MRLLGETTDYEYGDDLYNSTSAHAEENHASHNNAGMYVLITLIIFLVTGNIIRNTLLNFEITIPYTVCLLFISLTWGYHFDSIDDVENSAFAEATVMLTQIDPHLFLMVFIPPLIFESAFSVNFHTFERVTGQALVLAGPGIMLASLASAGISMILFPKWTFPECLLFGAMVSATDPVAVVALLRELGASKKLATLIEGESLLNDGTAFVLYVVVRDIVQGTPFNLGGIVWSFIRLSLGGFMWGWFMGWVIGLWLFVVNDDFLIETSLTVGGAFVSFYVGSVIHVSDILAVVAFGLYLSKHRVLISPHAQHAMHHIWEWLSYVANTLIFCLTGIIAAKVTSHFSWADLGLNIALYFGLHLVRVTVLLMFWPILKRLGYGFTYKELIVLSAGGLRGAIGLGIAMLTVLETINHADLMMFHTSCIVMWTLLVNASLMPFIIKFLEMDKLTEEGTVIFHQVIQRLNNEEENLLNSMKCDPMYSATDWETITDAMPDFDDLKKKVFLEGTMRFSDRFSNQVVENDDSAIQEMFNGKGNRATGNRSVMLSRRVKSSKHSKDTKDLAEYINMCDSTSLVNEIRHRVLATVKASYWHQFHEGMISEEATRQLVESAEIAMDAKSLSAQWNYLAPYITVPKWLCYIYDLDIPILNTVVRYVLCSNLQVGIQLTESFITSYGTVSSMFETFPEFANLPMAQQIIEEGKDIERIARDKQLQVKCRFADVYRAIKTHQATIFLLNQQMKSVNQLHSAGVVEDKEFLKIIHFLEKHFFAARTLQTRAILGKKGDLAYNIFKGLSWIRHLDDDMKDYLYKQCRTVTFQKGQKIQKHGETVDKLHLIVEGSIQLRSNGEVHEQRDCGQPIGLIATVTSESSHCDFIAQTDVLLIEVSKEVLTSLLDDCYSYKALCISATDILLERYFKDYFKLQTTVEINYRVQTGILHVFNYKPQETEHFTTEALLLKGACTTTAAKEDEEEHNIHAPALILPNEYKIWRGAVILELAPESTGRYYDPNPRKSQWEATKFDFDDEDFSMDHEEFSDSELDDIQTAINPPAKTQTVGFKLSCDSIKDDEATIHSVGFKLSSDSIVERPSCASSTSQSPKTKKKNREISVKEAAAVRKLLARHEGTMMNMDAPTGMMGSSKLKKKSLSVAAQLHRKRSRSCKTRSGSNFLQTGANPSKARTSTGKLMRSSDCRKTFIGNSLFQLTRQATLHNNRFQDREDDEESSSHHLIQDGPFVLPSSSGTLKLADVATAQKKAKALFKKFRIPSRSADSTGNNAAI